MSGRAFFDSNVLVYMIGATDIEKKEVASDLLDRAIFAKAAVISYQSLQEVVNVGFKRFRPAMTPREALSTVVRLQADCLVVEWSPSILRRAILLRERLLLQWWDCLLLSAAIEAECEIFYSEDLQHGQQIECLRVVSPFRS